MKAIFERVNWYLVLILLIFIGTLVGLTYGLGLVVDCSEVYRDIVPTYKIRHDGQAYQAITYKVDSEGTLTLEDWYVCGSCGCRLMGTRVTMPAGTYIIEEVK